MIGMPSVRRRTKPAAIGLLNRFPEQTKRRDKRSVMGGMLGNVWRGTGCLPR